MRLRPLTALAVNIAKSNLRDLRAPYKLTFALTYQCQLRCRICGIWKKPSADELSARELQDFFRSSPDFSWINLSGGEVFLRSDLPEILSVIDRNCRSLYLLNFPTNGFETDLIVKTIAEFIRESRVPRLMVSVSIDGPEELHDRLRGANGSWQRAVETYQRLRDMRSRRFDVYIGMTLQDANIGAFEETFSSVQRRIPDLQYRDLHVNVVHCSSHYYDNTELGGLSDPASAVSALERIMQLRRDSVLNPVGFLERRYQSLSCRFLLKGRTPLNCEALSSSCFMDPSGEVYACSIYDCRIGNIRDYRFSIGALWKSAARQEARSSIRQGRCPQCWTPCEAYQSLLANLLPRKVQG